MSAKKEIWEFDEIPKERDFTDRKSYWITVKGDDYLWNHSKGKYIRLPAAPKDNSLRKLAQERNFQLRCIAGILSQIGRFKTVPKLLQDALKAELAIGNIRYEIETAYILQRERLIKARGYDAISGGKSKEFRERNPVAGISEPRVSKRAKLRERKAALGRAGAGGFGICPSINTSESPKSSEGDSK